MRFLCFTNILCFEAPAGDNTGNVGHDVFLPTWSSNDACSGSISQILKRFRTDTSLSSLPGPWPQGAVGGPSGIFRPSAWCFWCVIWITYVFGMLFLFLLKAKFIRSLFYVKKPSKMHPKFKLNLGETYLHKKLGSYDTVKVKFYNCWRKKANSD